MTFLKHSVKQRETYTKPKTLKQIKKWLKNPHSDSAEYKMWGNGVTPCPMYVLSYGHCLVYTIRGEILSLISTPKKREIACYSSVLE